jgi:hypothetical protein
MKMRLLGQESAGLATVAETARQAIGRPSIPVIEGQQRHPRVHARAGEGA